MPCRCSISGGEADKTYYFTKDNGECEGVPSGYHCFTKTDLEMLMDFVSATEAKLIFGLSAGYPKYPDSSTKAWNSSNTKAFLDYIVANDYGEKFYGFELGNELNKDVEPSFQVNAFRELQSILTQLFGQNNEDIPILAGPDPHSYTLRYYWRHSLSQHTCLKHTERTVLTSIGSRSSYRKLAEWLMPSRIIAISTRMRLSW